MKKGYIVTALGSRIELVEVAITGTLTNDDLEDELMGFTTTGYIGASSPNRADWYVWAFTELFPGLTRKEQKNDGPIHIPKLVRF